MNDQLANDLYVAVVQPDTIWWDDLTPEMQDAWRRAAKVATPAASPDLATLRNALIQRVGDAIGRNAAIDIIDAAWREGGSR